MPLSKVKRGVKPGDEIVSGSYAAVSRKLKDGSLVYGGGGGEARNLELKPPGPAGSRPVPGCLMPPPSFSPLPVRPPGPLVIDIRNLVKLYQVGTETIHALRGVSLRICRNEYLAIMGPSGSGKSTIMNMLGCLDTPTSGSYEFNGKNVAVMSDDELAGIRNREIGFVFQTFNLLPRSDAMKNVELPLVYAGIPTDERRARARQTLQDVGLGDRLHHKPNELSGGQRQRVAIARALVNRPSIILADEPTGNLDSQAGTELMALFDELYERGNTLIVVTHEEEVARHSRRILRLRDGLIESDQPAP